MNNHGVLSTMAMVRFSVPGFHNWPGASHERAYLGVRHRHLFFVEVNLEVYHEDREVEFHDLLDFCRSVFPGGEMGGQSCEMMARGIVDALAKKYPNRAVGVSVSEDNEVGAVVRFTP